MIESEVKTRRKKTHCICKAIYRALYRDSEIKIAFENQWLEDEFPIFRGELLVSESATPGAHF